MEIVEAEMKIIADKDRTFVITEAFSGVLFRTAEGQELGVCMRDGGFEINIISSTGKHNWHSVLDGKIKRMVRSGKEVAK